MAQHIADYVEQVQEVRKRVMKMLNEEPYADTEDFELVVSNYTLAVFMAMINDDRGVN